VIRQWWRTGLRVFTPFGGHITIIIIIIIIRVGGSSVGEGGRVGQRALVQCGVCPRRKNHIYSREFALGVFSVPRKSLRPRKKGGVIKRLIKIGGHLPARVYAAHKLPVYYRHRLIYDRSSGARTQRRTPFVI